MNLHLSQKQAYLQAMRELESQHMQQSQEAFQVADDVPLLSSFHEDSPAVHQAFYHAHLQSDDLASDTRSLNSPEET